MIKKSLIVITLALAGCGTVGTNTVWLHPEATQAKLDADVAACAYETRLHVRAARPGYRTDIGREMDMNDQRAELKPLCLAAKGWTREIPGTAQ